MQTTVVFHAFVPYLLHDSANGQKLHKQICNE